MQNLNNTVNNLLNDFNNYQMVEISLIHSMVSVKPVINKS